MLLSPFTCKGVDEKQREMRINSRIRRECLSGYLFLNNLKQNSPLSKNNTKNYEINKKIERTYKISISFGDCN